MRPHPPAPRPTQPPRPPPPQSHMHSAAKSYKRSPPYKVMLHNDNYNRREYVVRILCKVVEGFTVEDAMTVMTVSPAGRVSAREDCQSGGTRSVGPT
jgi:hypothetical protein